LLVASLLVGSALANNLNYSILQVHKFNKFTKHYRNDIKRKLSYYRIQLGMNNKQIKKMLLAKPALLGFSIDNHIEKVSFFTDTCGLKLKVRKPASERSERAVRTPRRGQPQHGVFGLHALR